MQKQKDLLISLIKFWQLTVWLTGCLIAGFDGGMRQWFLMEIYDQNSGILQANISAKFAMFSVTGLDAGHLFRIYIYAANGRGRSEATVVDGYTLKAAEKQTGK